MLRCCDLARSRALNWTWIDTICINRTSFAELSEAINSMYRWYQRSTECYVFLDDVKWLQDQDLPSSVDFTYQNWQSFRNSRWFSRGWTLQELLAPDDVQFYSWDGTFLGCRSDLAEVSSSICGIGTDYLNKGCPIAHASVARRMSWAANRNTTKKEDVAYSHLGIFDISMPLLYGEGEKAFLRLQLAIMDRTDDDSILAWNIKTLYDSTNDAWTGILARSPHDFHGSVTVARTALSSLSGNRAFTQPTQRAVTLQSRTMPLGLRHWVASLRIDRKVQHITLACQLEGNDRNKRLTMVLIGRITLEYIIEPDFIHIHQANSRTFSVILTREKQWFT